MTTNAIEDEWQGEGEGEAGGSLSDGKWGGLPTEATQRRVTESSRRAFEAE